MSIEVSLGCVNRGDRLVELLFTVFYCQHCWDSHNWLLYKGWLLNRGLTVVAVLLFVDEFMPVFYLLESLSTSVTECGCKLLTVDDYISLLWTTAAEFPGKFQMSSP